MDISKLDKKTQNYIKDLEHAIDVQSELIEARKKSLIIRKYRLPSSRNT